MSSKFPKDETDWNTGGHTDFYTYYEKQSSSEAARQRFGLIHATLLRALGQPPGALRVGDIGCGAGTQCQLWARMGHKVSGVDINEALITLARERAQRAGLSIRFAVASATALPWDDHSLDLCIAPELLEHVADWATCLSEMVRVLRPGGALFVSTSNLLCPIQEEFDLPLYSWYPPFLKHRFEHLARTTRPDLAGYATYPAVNWFTYYGLRRHLARQGVRCMDRFDMMDLRQHGRLAAAGVRALRRLAPLRFLGHVCTPYTVVLGVKQATTSGSAPAARQTAAGRLPRA